MELAKIEVTGTRAKIVYARKVPKGIVGATVSIVYKDPIWDGLVKTVVFRGCVTRDVVNAGEVVTIPHEVVERANTTLMVGISGTDAENNLVIPTFWADLGTVRPAADPSGDPSADPSLPVWEQILQDSVKLQKQANETLTAAGEAREKAEQAQAGAEQSATNAALSEQNAADSESNAKESEEKAGQSETNADLARLAAEEAARRAALSEQGAGQSEQNALQSENDAAAFVGNAEQSAKEAKESAEKAAQHESNAKTSETNAKESEKTTEQAKTEAVEAKNAAAISEQNAKTSEDNAKQSEQKASTSETNAANSEQNAKKSEEEAAKSEEAARLYAESINIPKPSPDKVGKAIVVNPTGDGYTLDDAGVKISNTATPGQLIIVKSVDENGKPTEWEAVDRTHWAKDTMLELFNGVCVSEPLPELGGIYAAGYSWDDLEAIPTNVDITFDGVAYSVMPVTYMEVNGFDWPVVGNMSLANAFMGTTYEDTGEPFLAIINVGGGAMLTAEFMQSTTHTLSIKMPYELVQQLPEKFIDMTSVYAKVDENMQAFDEKLAASESRLKSYADQNVQPSNLYKTLDLTKYTDEIPVDGSVARISFGEDTLHGLIGSGRKPLIIKYKLAGEIDAYEQVVCARYDVGYASFTAMWIHHVPFTSESSGVLLIKAYVSTSYANVHVREISLV